MAHACKDGGDSEPNVENILTELRAITGRKGKNPVDGINKDKLKDLDEAVCDLIVNAVGQSLPTHRWTYSLNGVSRVLYRLPELLKADRDAVVYVCEGKRIAID